ncbi:RpiB/LacA/LacB family sugar-phosphate isomerase [Desulfurococcus mucosus]|uniref:Ribose-5-phosphate isomerase n=1 Tax=Desulfurococcus mucosus (strain ATCC 35584 / DSM 2162 / JCM 9187 / O7/1) TaxID=765177 RepID=E8RAD1_DESM0|nr:RpiB/LacA/LacB family sugar-phosphate isomerase [Desulfurococcus mucosus]ADV64341.1 ribose-5-phosphate isomerase [Desulfurococcus mucosus DSM 2162]
MRVAVGSDDTYSVAGFIAEYLRRKGFEVKLVGALATGKPYPWPDVGFEVGSMVARGEVDYGVVICYTGTGVSIAANKVKGVRAALVTDARNAEGARKWNDANVLALSARLTSEELAKEIIDAFFAVREVDPSEAENIRKLKAVDTLGDTR